MANETNPNLEPETESSLPIDGQVVAAIQANFAQRPMGGDDTWPTCSIGVGRNSVVATDSNSAIIVGENSDRHVATQRKEADIEAFRAKRLGQPVSIDAIPRNVDKKGEPIPMPPVERIIRKQLAGMKPLAVVSPRALLAIAKVAQASGAFTIELFQPEEAPDSGTMALGFRFAFVPRATNLFSEWDGEIEARGVFMTTKGETRYADDADESGEGESEEPKRSASVDVVTAPEGASSEKAPEVAPETKSDPEPAVDVTESRERGAYRLPPLSLLEVRLSKRCESGGHEDDIVELLRQNGIPARILAAHCGPAITQYEIGVPANVKGSRVAGMDSDLQRGLGVHSVRIQAPIPGKKAIGIEVPNPEPRTVGLLDLCARTEFVDAKARLTFALGEDIGGHPVYADLATMPHLLIGGATNSGKSIGLASILGSLLLRNTPADLRMVMIDPKRVELTLFDRIPHLMCPVVKDVKEAAGVLRAVWREMDRRYQLFEERGVRNIDGWNGKASVNEHLPYIVVVIDELADLMLQCGQESEQVIVRIAQMARATGIHLIVATQRPSADIVTGLIKANVPSRIAFAVAQGVDSQIILDRRGAEKLLGRGDMLFQPIGSTGEPRRVQGAYLSEDEVGAICRHWREQGQPQYTISLEDEESEPKEDPNATGKADGVEDSVLRKRAVRFAVDKGQCSTSMLQREFAIGFQKAYGLLEWLEKKGVVAPKDGPRPRDVIVSAQAAEEILAGEVDE